MSADGEALARLRRVYAALDEGIAEAIADAGAGCRACGRCCTFPPGSPVLYATALERAYLQGNGVDSGPEASVPDDATLRSAYSAEAAASAAKAGSSLRSTRGACPYLDPASRRCTARERRAVGCRTYFCADALPDAEARRRAEELCEGALAEIRDIAGRHGLEWDYAPAVERLRARR